MSDPYNNSPFGNQQAPVIIPPHGVNPEAAPPSSGAVSFDFIISDKILIAIVSFEDGLPVLARGVGSDQGV